MSKYLYLSWPRDPKFGSLYLGLRYTWVRTRVIVLRPRVLHKFSSCNLIEFYPLFVFLKVFYLYYFTSVSLLTYTRNFLFSLQNCWTSTSKNLGHGLMHRPLSRQVWLTLKNINLLAPTRGQRGGNHLRRPKDKPINVIYSC